MSDQVIDPVFYLSAYADLQNLTEAELITHWLSFGFKEGRFSNQKSLQEFWQRNSLPKDFDWHSYIFLNPDLTFSNEITARIHYISNGLNERRSYRALPFRINQELTDFLKKISLYEFLIQNDYFSIKELFGSKIVQKLSDEYNESLYIKDLTKHIIEFYQSFDLTLPAPNEIHKITKIVTNPESLTSEKFKESKLIIAIIKVVALSEFNSQLMRGQAIEEMSLHLAGESLPRNYKETLTLIDNKLDHQNYVRAKIHHVFNKISRLVNANLIKYVKTPKITLIASIYSGDDYIENFLNNITALKDFYKCELVFIDANSPGNEFEIIKNYQVKFPNIQYIRSDKRIGIYEAWNLAIKNTQSEYISNVNLDDLRLRNYLSLALKALDKQQNIDIVFGNFYYSFRPNYPVYLSKRLNLKSKLPLLTTHELLNFNAPHSAPIWRRRLHEEIGFFDEKFRSAGDWEFWLRCAESNKRFGQFNQAISVYFVNPSGISTNAESLDAIEQKEIRQRYKSLLESPEISIAELL